MPPKRPPLPAIILITNVPAGSQSSGQGGFYAQADATVTAHIENDPAGVFQVTRMETEDIVSEPDGPHGSIETLQPALVVNGPGPIDVSSEQALLVGVEFTCPPDPKHATFQASAVVQGPGFPARSIPITAIAALGTVEAVSLDSPPFFPGDTKTLQFTLSSSLGHDVPAALVYNSAQEPSFTAATQFRTVPSGGSVDLPAPVTCTPGTPEGEYHIRFEVRAQDGSQVFGSVQVGVTVTRQVGVFTNLPGDFSLKRGDSVLCELRVKISGSPAQFHVDHGPVPPPLSVDPAARNMTVDGAAFTNFDISVNDNAPPGRLSPLTFFWNVREPLIANQLVFNIDVVADQVVFPLPQPLEQLSQENSPKPLRCDQATLIICDDGMWNLTAHFQNQETLADVSFLFEVKLGFGDPVGAQFGETIDGALSAAGDGPATKIGLRILGYPQAGTFFRHGVFAPFQNPLFFQNAKASTPQFRMLAAFGEPDGGNIPDPPDIPEGEGTGVNR